MANGKRTPPPPGPGRPKGSKNKVPQELKAMILQALDESGGVEYLKVQAHENPANFLTLVGKVLPLTVQGTGEGGSFVVKWQK